MLNLSAQDVLKPFTTNQRTMTTLNSRLQLAMLNRKKGKKLAEKGFTLIELLITVVILGVLSGVAIPGFIAQKNKADVAAANAQGRALMAACKNYLSDNTFTLPNNIWDPSKTSAQNAKNFGNIIWTPTFSATTPVACSSITANAPQTQQAFALDMNITSTGAGDMTSDTPAR